MVPVVFVVTLGGGNAYAALPVNITVFGQASLIVLHRPKPLKKQHFLAVLRATRFVLPFKLINLTNYIELL